MKLTVTLLLLVTVSRGAEVSPSRSKQKEDSKTEKRALVEGNADIEKRAPVLATALPSVSPGIVYADSKELESDKSPQQQIYATPLPQLAKISDVLTGHGPSFQAAITSHLFSPVSIYQTRLPGYEVSAPLPSQLAYTEKITYQPQAAEQFSPQVFKQKQNFAKITYAQPVQYQQPQQLQTVNQYHQQIQPQVIQLQAYQPQQYQNLVYNQQPLQYQNPVQFSSQPLAYIRQQLPTPPGIVYTRQEEQQKPQRELKTVQPVHENIQEKNEQQKQNYNIQPQGAVSFASFSVGPPAPLQQLQQPQNHQHQNQQQYQQHQNQPQPQPYAQYRPQVQPQVHQYQPQQVQYQIQLPQPQAQQLQYQIQQPQPQQPTQTQIQHHHQYQIQRQPLPQFTSRLQTIQYQPQQQPQVQIQSQAVQKFEQSPANSVNIQPKTVAVNSGKQVAFYRQEPAAFQPQTYQGHGLVYQNQLANQPEAIPTFPPVQFFGKYAHELFKHYQQ